MNNLVCIFGKKVETFKSNYLDLLFKHQNIRISLFTDLIYFSCSSFKLRQNNNIYFSISFSLKLSFSK